jgi:excisionase family DNA binding protein
MAGYATAERIAQTTAIRPVTTARGTATPGPAQPQPDSGFDVLLDHLVSLVAERVVERLAAPKATADEWLDTRSAAEYLGVHRDTVRRLAAERTVPSEQEGPGCKLFFRRSDLDAWRCGARPLRVLSGGRS